MVTIHHRDTIHAMAADYFGKMPQSDAGIALVGYEPATGVGYEWIFAPPVAGVVLDQAGVAPPGVSVALDQAGVALDEMLGLDLDSRYDYLAANGFGESDLDAVARLSGEWINGPARARLRELAAECVAAGDDPVRLLKAWLYDDAMPRMQRLLPRYLFPNRGLAVCFALSSAYQLACSAHWVAEIDRRRSLEPPIDWSQFADPERVAEDVRLAEAGFEEEVAQWPAY